MEAEDQVVAGKLGDCVVKTEINLIAPEIFGGIFLVQLLFYYMKGGNTKKIRTIGIFKITNTKYYEDAVEGINVDYIPLNTLKLIITPLEEDPFLYGGYILSEEQLIALNPFLKNKITPNFQLYEYILECYGV